MRVCCHQPLFLPWVGFWNKVINTDCLVLLTDVDFTTTDYTHRTRIHGSWSTVRLHKQTTKGVIDGVMASSLGNIRQRIQNELCVKRYRHHDRLFPILETIEKYESLLETPEGYPLAHIDMDLMFSVAKALGFQLNCALALSRYPKDPGMTKAERLGKFLDDCMAGIPYTYYSGAGARDYMTAYSFQRPVLFQNVVKPHGGDSVLQILAREEDPLSVIKNAATWETE